ncbi:hypothetical protein H0H92_013540, partial [Tricholoma furcatifolium]
MGDDSMPEMVWSASYTPVGSKTVYKAAPSKFSEAWSVARHGLETTIRLLSESAGAFSPLKAAAGGLVACIDLIETATANCEGYQDLVSQLTTMGGILAQYMFVLDSIDHTESVARIAQSIQEEVDYMIERQAHERTRQILEARENQGDIIKHYRIIGTLFSQLQADISLQTLHSAKNLDQVSCTPQTREAILADLKKWAKDMTGAKVYWMNGMAGT